MDNLFTFLFELLIDQSLSPEQPKIEVRLLSYFPNPEHKLDVEIENISNSLIELESVILVLKEDEGCKLFQQILNLTTEQQILPPFSPQRISFITFENRNSDRVIKYFEFKLKNNRKTKLKVTPK